MNDQEEPRLIKKIYHNPTFSFAVMIVIGGLLLITMQPVLMIAGALLALYAGFILWKQKNDLVLEIWSDGLYICESQEKITYDQIYTWSCYPTNGADVLELYLNDDRVVNVSTFNINRIASALWKIIPEKEKKNKYLDTLKKEQPKNKWYLWLRTIFDVDKRKKLKS